MKLDYKMPESTPQILNEFHTFDSKRSWNAEYQRIRNLASVQHQSTQKIALRADNRDRNRYRDVSPYDDYRIALDVEPGENDYINASPVEVPLARRKYILSQGPLANTSGHFWMMVWQQMTLGVIMLNNVVENGRQKCNKYYPDPHTWPGTEELDYDDTNFTVKHLSSVNKSIYILRTLLLTNNNTGESREIVQYHYTSWPDFDVPDTTNGFLQFLFDVRQSGILTNTGPAVIHCSAGIGRSGTFCLVDSALVLVEEARSLDVINVRKMLLDLRRYRCGLIQTAGQLRFSYQAIIDGSEHVLNSTNHINEPTQDDLIRLEEENESESETESDEELPPSKPAPPPPKSVLSKRREISPTRPDDEAGDSPPPCKKLPLPGDPAPPPPPRTTSIPNKAPRVTFPDQPEERVASDMPLRTSILTKHASLDRQQFNETYDRQMSLPASAAKRTDTDKIEEIGYINPQRKPICIGKNGLRKRRESKTNQVETAADESQVVEEADSQDDQLDQEDSEWDWEVEEPGVEWVKDEDYWSDWFIAGAITVAIVGAGTLFYKYYWLT